MLDDNDKQKEDNELEFPVSYVIRDVLKFIIKVEIMMLITKSILNLVS